VEKVPSPFDSVKVPKSPKYPKERFYSAGLNNNLIM
jgi:hypothetical protein